MNERPIEQARDADLRSSKIALLRAAARARELAVKTGTQLVISRSGIIEYLTPHPHGVREPDVPYGKEP